VILFVNRAELLTTNRRREETVGLNYFSDVAPCAAVKEFPGRFIEFIAARDERRISFGFFFIFGWEHNEVKVTLHKHGADASHVYITTEITAVSET
jgi:photoactive yellow protein